MLMTNKVAWPIWDSVLAGMLAKWPGGPVPTCVRGPRYGLCGHPPGGGRLRPVMIDGPSFPLAKRCGHRAAVEIARLGE